MNILHKASDLVHGQRGESYGHPFDDYECTAQLWRAMIKRRYGVDIPITPDFACLMMVQVKMSREANQPALDNRVDAAGYLECSQMCLEHGTPEQWGPGCK